MWKGHLKWLIPLISIAHVFTRAAPTPPTFAPASDSGFSTRSKNLCILQVICVFQKLFIDMNLRLASLLLCHSMWKLLWCRQRTTRCTMLDRHSRMNCVLCTTVNSYCAFPACKSHADRPHTSAQRPFAKRDGERWDDLDRRAGIKENICSDRGRVTAHVRQHVTLSSLDNLVPVVANSSCSNLILVCITRWSKDVHHVEVSASAQRMSTDSFHGRCRCWTFVGTGG